MAYRRTARIDARLAARRRAIVIATRRALARDGFRGLSMQRVADDAGVAIGTLYRYFPSKTELCTEVVGAVSERELQVLRDIAASGGPPLERLWTVIATFSRRALAAPTFAYAMMAEPVEPAVDRLRLRYRGELAAEVGALVEESIAAGALPPERVTATAAFVVGAFIEGIIGPHAPAVCLTTAGSEELARDIASFCLRGAGASARDLARARALEPAAARPAPA